MWTGLVFDSHLLSAIAEYVARCLLDAATHKSLFRPVLEHPTWNPCDDSQRGRVVGNDNDCP